MKNLKPTLVILLLVLFSLPSFSQISIWEEDFAAYPDETTVGTANRWTIATTPGVNLLPGTSNHFWTIINQFETRNTFGLEQVFTTEAIDISTFINVSVTLDVSEQGSLENTDYINVYYILNGGPETLFATNGQNNANFSAQVPQQTGLNGNTLQVVIRATTDANGERISFDNILVQGSQLPISPGAVNNNLQLWMRADDGIAPGEAIDNTEVTSWIDQSAFNLVAASEINGPDYIEEGINFNPALRFDRNSDTYFNLGQPANLDIRVGAGVSGRSDISVFAAFITDGSGAGTILAKGNNNVRSYQLWLGDTDRVVHYTWGRDQENASFDSRNWGDIHGRNEPKITTGTVNASGYKSYVNNIEDNMIFDLGVGDGFATTDVMIGARRSGDGTNNSGTGNRLSGDVAEIIVYNRELTTLEIKKVNSYLAIKYGITLGYNDETFVNGDSPETQGITYSGSSNDYIASNGSTLWSGTANAGYGYNVFGIARDDNSNLLQLKSKSSNVQRIEISPGNANFLDAVLTIEDEDGIIDNDLSYLLAGHNGQDISLQTALLPERSESLLNRIWKSRESNTDTGKTTLTFDLNQYIATTITNPEDLVLFVADNSSFNGYCNYVGTISSNILTFSGVDLAESNYFTLGVPTTLNGDLDIDFDGNQSFISSDRMLGGKTQATIMGWVKPGGGFNNKGTIAGEESFCISLNDNLIPVVDVVTDTGTSIARNAHPSDEVPNNQWVHIAAVYDASTSSVKIYINGRESIEDPSNIPNVTGASLSTTIGTAFSTFAIGKDGAEFGTQFFKGDIDEVRVLDIALTENQLRKMIFQEITQNGGNIRGTIIPKDIDDDTTALPVSWNNMIAYYPMSSISGNVVFDVSNNAVQAKLNNIGNDIKAQTAPLPFTTSAATDLSLESTFTNGSIWNISNVTDIDWSILQVNHNVTTSNAIKTLGLFVNSGNTITVTGDNEVNNSWYLELNGTLDLADDSQLVQGPYSDLVTSADGKILRRQEGNSDVYWYNYWSPPVGSIGTTALTNNNTNSNNTNNTPFNLSMLKDGTGANMNFTSSYDDVGMISNRWLFSFLNGQDYYGWSTLTPTSAIAPGVGYTQKGAGVPNANGDQEYIFEGKPNNGTVLIQADDIDGDTATESDDGSRTTTFVGNPYPSALDARQFILDNNGVIGGTVYVWEQWAGTSHILEEYQGGYGSINNMTTEVAYQWNDPSPSPTADPMGRKPTFYIPVAQGFFVEVINDGNNAVLSSTDDIEFNNGQRIFIKEGDIGDGSNPNNGSVFFRNSEIEAEITENEAGMIRLELTVSNGNKRSFVLAFSDLTTDGFDYGYDSRTIDPEDDDINSFIGNQKMLIQSFSPITEDKVIDLVFNSTGNYDYTLEIVEINGIDENQDIYLRDNLTGNYHNLRNGASFSSDVNGEDTDRFDVVFKNDETLSNDIFDNNNVIVYMNNLEDKLFIKGIDQDAKSITLTNMLGQTVKSMIDVPNNTMENGISIQNLSSGIYLVNIKKEDNSQLSKKIILD